ncbi:MMPL family transporter [Streptomyces sp. SID13666]|uniref:MMPL family transporter n=1 Tax=unclassified Streptomyces TaxID=2593676 RepID=UPI0013C1D33A|nr:MULTISPECIES: MMPL family transporter [unclassified Streptomyces]NEA55100.1 MMPL family transporter [Streptomyces sp. SID13666]NEA71107.1 MMPL family transporter [Streptomyces sp. SID13588]
MERMTRWVLAHRLQVVLAWVVLTLVGGALSSSTIKGLSFESRLPDKPAQVANDTLAQRFSQTGGKNAPLLLVVTVPEGTTADSDGVRKEWGDLVAKVTPHGGRSVSYANTGDDSLISRDKRTTVALVYPPANHTNVPYEQSLPGIKQTVERTKVAGARVELTGQPVLSGRDSGAQRSPIFETLIGALGALVVLGLVFTSGLAIVPLLMAGVAIPTTFLLVRAITGVTDVSFIVQYLVALIGLGIAIDYALLVVTRWREERQKPGADGPEPAARRLAVIRSVASAGHAVALSGATVAISLAALVVLPVPFLRSVGYAGLLIPLVSVAVALTLLPVLLYSWGDKLDRPRRVHRPDSKVWGRIAGVTTRRPVLTAVISGALLLGLAAPVFALRLGQPATVTLAQGGEPAAAFQRIVDAGFGEGIARPVEVLVEAGGSDAMNSKLAGLEGVAGSVAPADWGSGGQRIVEVWTKADPSSADGRDTVTSIMDAAQGTPGALVGGGPAQDVDFIDAVYGSLGLILIFVALLTFIVLARTLRSVVLPIKALILNALSTCAAYGVVVLIWQKGYGSEALFDTPAIGAVTIWIPMAVFAFLFGLSMDYEVFILHRIRETHLELTAKGEHDTVIPSVVTGISRTGRLVTSAALILFLAFIALASIPITDVKVFATALAAGIIIDATVVRGLLTPALVTLLGRSNWWFPHSLGRLLVTTPGQASGPRSDPADDVAEGHEGQVAALADAASSPKAGPQGRA